MFGHPDPSAFGEEALAGDVRVDISMHSIG